MGDIDMKNSVFAYTATIKLAEIAPCAVQREFPGVCDLAVSSRNFDDYFDCSTSVRSFMDSVAARVNAEMPEDRKYVITTEVNPVYSNVDTKSKDWGSGELARVWMFTAAQEDSSTIHAVGQARVFMAPREAAQLN